MREFADVNKDKGPCADFALLNDMGFNIIDAIERRPHEDMEYPTTRAYIWAEKNKEIITGYAKRY